MNFRLNFPVCLHGRDLSLTPFAGLGFPCGPKDGLLPGGPKGSGSVHSTLRFQALKRSLLLTDRCRLGRLITFPIAQQSGVAIEPFSLSPWKRVYRIALVFPSRVGRPVRSIRSVGRTTRVPPSTQRILRVYYERWSWWGLSLHSLRSLPYIMLESTFKYRLFDFRWMICREHAAMKFITDSG